MKRRLLNLLTILSLLLCVAAVALWIRSYWAGDELQWNRERREDARYEWHERHVMSWAGGLRFDVRGAILRGEFLLGGTPEYRPGLHWTVTPDPLYPHMKWPIEHPEFSRHAFVWDADRSATDFPLGLGRYDYYGYILVFPHWLLAALAAAIPLLRSTLRLRQPRRKRRALKHQCIVCGYDLRATPGRCPECGAGDASDWGGG